MAKPARPAPAPAKRRGSGLGVLGWLIAPGLLFVAAPVTSLVIAIDRDASMVLRVVVLATTRIVAPRCFSGCATSGDGKGNAISSRWKKPVKSVSSIGF